jgi:hypothetical protein
VEDGGRQLGRNSPHQSPPLGEKWANFEEYLERSRENHIRFRRNLGSGDIKGISANMFRETHWMGYVMCLFLIVNPLSSNT